MYGTKLPANSAEQKFVSVLLPARNEARFILACLLALKKSDYPAGRFEVLVGNDGSEDETAEIASDFCRENPGFRLLEIPDDFQVSAGKARALAFLAGQAKGEILLMTDADTEVSAGWIRAMTGSLATGSALVSGPTLPQGNSFLSRLIYYEFASVYGFLYAAGRFGFSLTASGNNLGISRKTYSETGGYDEIPFSLTEDLALFRAIKKGKKQLLSAESLARTAAPESWPALARQRKRWVKGAWPLLNFPQKMLCLLYTQSLLLPILGFFYSEFRWIFGLKIVADLLFAGLCAKRTRTDFNLLFFGLSEITGSLFTFFLPFYVLFGPKIRWKNRTFRTLKTQT